MNFDLNSIRTELYHFSAWVACAFEMCKLIMVLMCRIVWSAVNSMLVKQ